MGQRNLEIPESTAAAAGDLEFDLAGAIESHAKARPHQIALESLDPQGRVGISWPRFADDIRDLSQYLLRSGVEKDDRVAILMENQPRWGVAFLAVHRAGGIAVPLDTVANVPALVNVVRHSQAKFLIASPKFHEQALEIVHSVPFVGVRMSSEAEWEAAISAKGAAALPLPSRSLDDNLAILYTGGTTGASKGVLLTLRNVARSILDMLEVFPLTPTDRVLSVLPLYHIMPLLANLLAPVFTGCSVIFLNHLDPDSLRRAFQQEGITGFLCVPQFYYQMQRRILEEVGRQSPARQRAFRALLWISGFLRRRFNLRAGKIFFRPIHQRFGAKLRAFGFGGAYFNPKTAEFFADLGFRLFQAYGLTECSGLASATPLDKDGGLSCGLAVAHCEVRIVNPDASGVGEILVRGENIMQGYWRDPDATAAVLKDGWLHTGDLGTLDSCGTLRITGRAKDVVVLSSGKNVFPEELEEYFLSQCDLLQEICFVGLDGPDGALLHCALYPRQSISPAVDRGALDKSVRAQLAAAARKLPGYKRPGSIQILNEPLPRTTTRKLQRFKVREMAPMNSPWVAADSAAEPAGPVERELGRLIRRLRPDAPLVTGGMSLDLDLGLDSLERVELLSNVEKTFNIRIADTRAAQIFTVQHLLDEVRERASGEACETGWTSWTELLGAPLTNEESAFAEEYLRRRPVLERWWYGVSRALGAGLHLLMKMKVHHAAAFPQPPFVICPNHVSYIDTPVGICMLPYAVFSRLFVLGLSSYFRAPFMRWLAGMLRIVPVDAGQHLMWGIRMGKAGLERGLVLWVHPEGTRSPDGRLQEFRRGPALLARELRVPVVPMGIAGTFEIWPRGHFPRRCTPIAISTGAPMMVEDGESEEAFNRRLREAIATQVRIAESLRS
jgi:long-chain acyl-CoA synthetase